jgi:hypothetical protein
LAQQHKGKIDGYTIELLVGDGTSEGTVVWQDYSEKLSFLLNSRILRDATGDEHVVEDDSIIAIKKWAKSKGFSV